MTRPGQSQGLLYKHLCPSLTDSLINPIVRISLRRCHVLMLDDGAFSHKIDYVLSFLVKSKSQGASKLLQWFKSYGDF